ncbi:MAG: flagellar cap protein FliD N-terminal domain-containing protein, partial [Desulfarculaceae bacterium]
MADTSAIDYTTYQMPTGDFNVLSGSINFTGLGSGTDFNEIIDQLVAIESIQMQRLEVWKQTWEAKINSMRALNQRMNAIEEAAAAMDTADEFMESMAATSDTSVLTATPSTSAQNGAYQVEVGQDIKHIVRSTGCADAGTTAYGGAGGTLVINIAGTDYNVAINNTDTLNDIASAINTAVGSTVATVENDGTSSRPYHLIIKSTTGGDAGRITVSQNPTDLSLDYKDVVMQDPNTFTPNVSVAGQFTGDSATASVYTYTF